VSDNRIQKIVIVGGGTAGWMAACTLANRFSNKNLNITLVESPSINTVGVGEATVPYIKEFLQDLKIDEVDFIKQTNATYKLAIEFDGWHSEGQSFMHPFAGYGARIARIPFHHYWIKLKATHKAGALDNYCLASQMAYAKKFALPKPHQDIELSTFNYAFHFDARLFALYLEKVAVGLGVNVLRSTVTSVNQNPHNGFIESLKLDTGETLDADLFIDCSGFSGLLIEKTLHTGYLDWSHWLPCNRAIAMPCATTQLPPSSTRALACEAGWQWRIPLQNRVGNGYVYSSQHLEDEHAAQHLLTNLEGKPLADPLFIQFTTGMRAKTWNKNVLSLGLASGFLEPLESTSIYLIQSTIEAFINHFPNKDFDPYLTDNFNSILKTRQERLRDFIILHYYGNQRSGEAFWDDVRTMPIPLSLQEKIDSFIHTAQVPQDDLDFFRTSSWLALFSGLGIQSKRYHPAVDNFSEQALEKELQTLSNSILKTVETLPTHLKFIQNNCAIKP